MSEDNKPEEKSKYNEASLQVLRLHELELRIEAVLHNSDTLNKEIKYHFLLDSYWRELTPDLKKIKSDNRRRYFIITNKLLRMKWEKEIDKTKTYLSLNDRHILLKELKDEVGRGGIYTDGREDNFD